MTPEQRQVHKHLMSILPVRTYQEMAKFEKKPNAVVTPEILEQMRKAEASGMTRFDIALQFNIASATVTRRLGAKRKCSRR